MFCTEFLRKSCYIYKMLLTIGQNCFVTYLTYDAYSALSRLVLNLYRVMMCMNNTKVIK